MEPSRSCAGNSTKRTTPSEGVDGARRTQARHSGSSTKPGRGSDAGYGWRYAAAGCSDPASDGRCGGFDESASTVTYLLLNSNGWPRCSTRLARAVGPRAAQHGNPAAGLKEWAPEAAPQIPAVSPNHVYPHPSFAARPRQRRTPLRTKYRGPSAVEGVEPCRAHRVISLRPSARHAPRRRPSATPVSSRPAVPVPSRTPSASLMRIPDQIRRSASGRYTGAQASRYEPISFRRVVERLRRMVARLVEFEQPVLARRRW